jgi:acyl-coenzyme A thioesterase PaaI-like protein
MLTPDQLNQRGVGFLPGLLGLVVTQVSEAELSSELPLQQSLMAPNGYLHAGSVVTLADTSAGYGCIANLPEGATGRNTVKNGKENYESTASSF